MTATQPKFEALDRLPQFPAIATKVLRALSHTDAGVHEISDYVCADAALASGLLRTVNSAVFGLPSEVRSVQRALMLMGFEAVRRFVLAYSMRAYYLSGVRLDLLRDVWRHSLACALLAEELSAACSSASDPDGACYTAALLHDIGRFGLLAAYPAEYGGLGQEPARAADRLELERQALGFDHCETGRWLAKRWDLPECVQLAAATHHSPPRRDPFELPDLVAVAVLLAEWIGLDSPNPGDPGSLNAIRALLPLPAQYRFDPDPAVLKARIHSRLDAFD